MAKLIKGRSIEDDSWVLLKEFPEIDAMNALDTQDVIFPLNVWLGHREHILGRQGRNGVWLQSNELPASIAGDISLFSVIALNFPVFSDGRAYSSARELRLDMLYAGELRAIGDVLRDQLFYMASCGFNAFAMREDQNLERALGAFDDFKEGYQTSVDRPIPLFRRRA